MMSVHAHRTIRGVYACRRCSGAKKRTGAVVTIIDMPAAAGGDTRVVEAVPDAASVVMLSLGIFFAQLLRRARRMRSQPE